MSKTTFICVNFFFWQTIWKKSLLFQKCTGTWNAGVNNFFKGQSESHVLSEGSNMQCDVRKIRSMTLELWFFVSLTASTTAKLQETCMYVESRGFCRRKGELTTDMNRRFSPPLTSKVERLLQRKNPVLPMSVLIITIMETNWIQTSKQKENRGRSWRRTEKRRRKKRRRPRTRVRRKQKDPDLSNRSTFPL